MKTTDSAKNLFEKIQISTGKGALGILIVALYPFCIYFVIGTLGTYHFQDKLQNIVQTKNLALDEPQITLPSILIQIDQLERIDHEKNVLEQRRETLVLSLEKLEQAFEASLQGKELKQLIIQRQIINAQLSETKETIFDFEDATISFLEEKEIRDIATELQFITRFFPLLPLVPKYILTLILTLAMGALGSLLYITHSFFRGESEHPISWYLLRPFLGTSTALAMFILVKAGQMTVSSGAMEESLTENLNPFFISFLAIISGLLSEQAIEKIKNSAIPILRINKKQGVERWGIGILNAMNKQNKKIEDLAQFIDFPLSQINDWIEDHQAIPENVQALIASYLQTPARELFTDIPPKAPF